MNNLLDTLLGLNPSQQEAQKVNPDKQLLDHLERALIQAFPQIYSSPLFPVLKPLVDEYMPDDKTIYGIATGIMNREGELWAEMEKHLTAIIVQYENRVISVEHVNPNR
jgi:hypothetical protein